MLLFEKKKTFIKFKCCKTKVILMKKMVFYGKLSLILTVIFCSSMMTNYLIAQDLKSIKYTDGKQSLVGLITSNAGKEAPGVLILPAWKGMGLEGRGSRTTFCTGLHASGGVSHIFQTNRFLSTRGSG